MQSSELSRCALPSWKGVYALVLELTGKVQVKVRRRDAELAPGLYVYIGSAKGPGGLRARVERHARREKRVRWHVDQLTTAASRILVVVYALSDARECVLTPYLEQLGFSHPIPGFGSSDCGSGCASHLFQVGCDLATAVELVREAFRRARLRPEVCEVP
jgi:Uncharacterized conserved protein|uniref:GIY-YIG nuclease family protein n=1 Tax=Thermofilum pendens TaxID=2269 RepID=A0A7C3SKY3_THEPE